MPPGRAGNCDDKSDDFGRKCHHYQEGAGVHSDAARGDPSPMGMNLDVAGVDHQPLKVRIVNDRIQQLFPDASVPPPAKAAMGVLPVPVIRRQVPPRSLRYAESKTPRSETAGCPWQVDLFCLRPQATGAQSFPNLARNIVTPMRCHHTLTSTLTLSSKIYHQLAILTTPLSTTAALTLTRCFRPQISLVSLRAETLAVARRYDFQDRPTLQATICGCSTRSRQSCFEYPAKGRVSSLPSRDSMNVSRFPRMSTVTPNRSLARIAAT